MGNELSADEAPKPEKDPDDLNDIKEEDEEEEEETPPVQNNAINKNVYQKPKPPPKAAESSKSLFNKPKVTLLKKAEVYRRNSGIEMPTFDPNMIQKPDKIKRANTVPVTNKQESEDDYSTKSSNDKKSVIQFEVSNKKTKLPPGSKFDETTNLEMWERIIKNSLMGSGYMKKALVFNMMSGGIYACSPPTYGPTVEQLKAISLAIHQPSSLAATGIEVAGDYFRYDTAKVGVSLRGIAKDGDTQMLLRIGKSSGVIVVYDRRQQEDVLKLVEELYEYFSEAYHF